MKKTALKIPKDQILEALKAMKKTALKIPKDQMLEALKPRTTTAVTVVLMFSPGDVARAVAWANVRRYNYDDLGDLLSQWALDGSPGGAGPDIDESSYGFYGR